MEQDKQLTSLPENAYRELKPGEEYTPVMPASSNPKEVTPYSVTMGVIMAIVFSAAAAFLGLKVGQVFEAAIPIAIIAVGHQPECEKTVLISLMGHIVQGIRRHHGPQHRYDSSVHHGGPVDPQRDGKHLVEAHQNTGQVAVSAQIGQDNAGK